MKNSVLVINCGSSSIKFQIVDPHSEEVLFKGIAENIGSNRCTLSHSKGKIDLPKKSYEHILHAIIELTAPFEQTLAAVGHRVVHGGEFFNASVLIDDDVEEKIKTCENLAPLHNPVNLLGIRILRKTFPKLPHIAVFDTAFHATMKEHAFLYAVNYSYYKELKIRRYGFHGTSHRYISLKAKELYEKKQNIIVAHLGNGCSISAVADGVCQDTSMGLTPLEGLVMGTRCGDIDVSIVNHLCSELSLTPSEVTDILNKESGLKGLSQQSADMRILEEKALENDPRALIAIEVFCYRVAKYVYAYHVPLQNVDAIIFTGGIGENSSYIREKIVKLLPHYSINEKENVCLPRGEPGIISEKSSPLIAVIPTNEELLIAKDAQMLGEHP